MFINHYKSFYSLTKYSATFFYPFYHFSLILCWRFILFLFLIIFIQNRETLAIFADYTTVPKVTLFYRRHAPFHV